MSKRLRLIKNAEDYYEAVNQASKPIKKLKK